MLTKRTNILFDEQTYSYLVALADKSKSSVGELVRKAVINLYLPDKDSIKRELRKKALNHILSLKKNIKPISDKEIKEFIAYGRE